LSLIESQFRVEKTLKKPKRKHLRVEECIEEELRSSSYTLQEKVKLSIKFYRRNFIRR